MHRGHSPCRPARPATPLPVRYHLRPTPRRIGGIRSRYTGSQIPVGARFGRLTVIGPCVRHVYRVGAYAYRYDCRCDCGILKNVNGSNLLTGDIVSCGCYRQEVAGQHQRTFNVKDRRAADYRLYNVWQTMIAICIPPRIRGTIFMADKASMSASPGYATLLPSVTGRSSRGIPGQNICADATARGISPPRIVIGAQKCSGQLLRRVLVRQPAELPGFRNHNREKYPLRKRTQPALPAFASKRTATLDSLNRRSPL